MTRYLLDVASFQGSLATADVVRAGFTAVNLKLSHGLTQSHVHPDIAGWVSRARAAGLGISTFHYLDGSASGAAQATYAYDRLRALGLVTGTAHQADCESTATEAIVREYVTTMQALLQRPVALYTGDWWWQPKGWDISGLTPYLWAAPDAGYLAGYPGDTSPHWTAGYGGWPELSVMQYAVAPLSFPDGTTGSIDVSKSAIRTDGVWMALTGGTNMTFAPQSLLDCRKPFKAHTDLPDVSLGIVGDDNHAQTASSYHLGKSANKPSSYSITESSRDSAGLSEAASAFDIGYFTLTAGGRTHDLRSFSLWLVAQCAAGTADTKDIREVIYSPDGKTVKRWDRLGVRSTGDDSHLTHTHTSWFRDSETHDRAAVYRRYFDEILGDDMPLTPADAITTFNSDNVITNRPWRGDVATNPKVAANTAVCFTWDDAHAAAVAAQTVLTEMRLMRTALLTAVTAADDGAAVIAAVQAEGAKQAARDAALAGSLQEAATELDAIKHLLENAGGSPNLAPVIERLDALSGTILGRLAAASEAETAALRAAG